MRAGPDNNYGAVPWAELGGLGELETLFNVTLLDGAMGDGPDAWTPANGGLTATNKIQRKAAQKLIQGKYGDAFWKAALRDDRKALKEHKV